MQVKKEELRQSIYHCAVNEFLSKGYENASMRTIAKKANTSTSNLYHYYASKEVLLDEMMKVALNDVDHLFASHLSLNVRVHSMDEIDEVLDMADDDVFGLSCLLKPELVIFIKQDQDRYRDRKEALFSAFRQHLAWHINSTNPDEHFIQVVLNMFLESIVFIVKSNQNKEKAVQDFIRIFRMMCSGIITKK